jgi:hypothetical protein
MPGGDRTGPMGMGPRTGWGAGFCAGYGVAGFANPGYWRGVPFGARGGRGWRNRFFATGVPGWQWFARYPIYGGSPFYAQSGAPQDELDALKGQAQYLENCLKKLHARMEALASEKKPE